MMLATLQSRLRHALAVRQVTAKQLALELNVSPATVSGWLATGNPRLEHLVGLSRYMNLSLDWLLLNRGRMDLHGPLHLSVEEQQMIGMLQEMGGLQTLTAFYNFLDSVLKPQLGMLPFQQISMNDMLNKLGCPLCVLDEDGIVCDANLASLAMLNIGGARDVFVGSAMTSWMKPERQYGFIECLRYVSEQNIVKTFECELRLFQQNTFIPVCIALLSRQHNNRQYLDCLMYFHCSMV